MLHHPRQQLLVEVPASDPSTINLFLTLASEVKAGIWGVFVIALLIAVLIRKKVSDGLDAHFTLMREMTEHIQTNAANQTKNAESQAKLADTLRQMEATDQLTRNDLLMLDAKLDRILEYQTGLPMRTQPRVRIPRYQPPHLDVIEDTEPYSEPQ